MKTNPLLNWLVKGRLIRPFTRYIYYKNVFKQAIDKIGINDKIYDWMLVDEPLPLEDPEIYFDIIPNEAEFIKQICEELKNIEKSEAEKEMKIMCAESGWEIDR